MRIGWLIDDCLYIGGAERSASEFREAAPWGVEVIDCPIEAEGWEDVDRYVIHNCVSYSPQELQRTQGKPTFKYWHDIGPNIIPEQHEAMSHATKICTSPLQAKKMGIDAELIPPAVPLAAFRAARNGSDRRGAVAVGRWMEPQKGAVQTAEWGAQNGGVDFYGYGNFAPKGTPEVAYEDLPALLSRYKTFVHLPRQVEPFGRAVVEAWAAGCEIIVNNLVGSRWWITEHPEKLDCAAQDFWKLVLR